MAKAKREQQPRPDEPVETGGSQAEGGGQLAEPHSYQDEQARANGTDGEPSAVKELEPGEMEGAIASLGDAVAAQDPTGTLGLDLSEAAHERQLVELEVAAASAHLDPASLIADLRDAMLGQVKQVQKPWHLMTPAQQRDLAAALEQSAGAFVRRVVEEIAARGQEPVRVFLKKVVIGEKIELAGEVKTFSQDEEDSAVTLLHHARGKNVMLTVASKEDYAQSHREAETDVEEPALDFEAGGAEVSDSDLAAEHLIDGEPDDDEAPEITRTGDALYIDQHGDCEAVINLKTGMVEAQPRNGDSETDRIDVREATPDELAAERERTADFGEDEPEPPLSPMPEIGSGDE